MRLAIDIATTAAMGVAINVPDRTHWYCATAALRSRRMISPPGVAERVGAVYRCSCDLRYPIAAIRFFSGFNPPLPKRGRACFRWEPERSSLAPEHARARRVQGTRYM
ncbi:MAG TPA: hypothetical protein VNQ56_15240 [Pseudolabrys sp.]|nr:hypothetical protein [Pseudolabrys sp.]